MSSYEFRHSYTALIAAVLLSFSSPLELYAQEPLFSDDSELAGVTKRHRNAVGWANMAIGTGAAWIDFNKDSNLDLFLTHGVGKNDFFLNKGDGTFEEIADSIGVADWNNKGSGVAVADYNNDGWPDLFLANADEDVLLKNVGGTHFIDVTVETELDKLPSARGMSAAWGDYNNDGFVDLYITNHTNFDIATGDRLDRLMFNQAGEKFIDVSYLIQKEALNGYGFIGAWTDFDNDGDSDIFLVNDCGFLLEGVTHTRLFRNDGGTDPLSWVFTDVSVETGTDHCHSGMGIAVGDYNRDGWTDYFYTNIGEETLLLENQQGTFVDKAEAAGVLAKDVDGVELWTWGANFFDVNLDGWLDLFVDAGELNIYTPSRANPQPNLFFMSNGDGTFTNLSQESGLASEKRSRTSIYGDYDNDGDPDLFLVNGNEDVYLFKNEQVTNNNWLIVRLEGVESNRDAIGAKIKLTDRMGTHQYWEVRSGSSLGGGDDVRAYFGLGNESSVSLEITWPSGIVQTETNLAANQNLHLIEPVSGVDTERLESPQTNLKLTAYPNPFFDQINFSLSGVETAYSLEIFDVMGRQVYTERIAPQTQQLEWSGTDHHNNDVAAGVYTIRLSAPNHPPSYQFIVKN